MKSKLILAACISLIASSAYAQQKIGETGSSNLVVDRGRVLSQGKQIDVNIARFDDPAVPNVSCYFTAYKEETGDPKYVTSCRPLGPVVFPAYLIQGEATDFIKMPYFEQNYTMYRWLDKEKHALIYTVVRQPNSSAQDDRSIFVITASSDK